VWVLSHAAPSPVCWRRSLSVADRTRCGHRRRLAPCPRRTETRVETCERSTRPTQCDLEPCGRAAAAADWRAESGRDNWRRILDHSRGDDIDDRSHYWQYLHISSDIDKYDMQWYCENVVEISPLRRLRSQLRKSDWLAINRFSPEKCHKVHQLSTTDALCSSR